MKNPAQSRFARGGSLLGALLLGALGCSWITEFVVVNASRETILVSYVFKPRPADSCCEAPVPALAKAADLDKGEPWREVSPALPAGTLGLGRVVVRVAPGEALRIADLGNYSRPTLRDWQEFPIQELEVRNSRGALRLCGPALLLAFEAAARHRQELEFLGHPRQLHSGICEPPPKLGGG